MIPPLEKEEKLVNKVKHLLKKAKLPRYLNKFGPKKYAFYEHAFFLLIKTKFQLSFRRCSKALVMLGFKAPSKSTLAYQSKKIPLSVWKKILFLTNEDFVKLGAIDSTGFSGNNPSWHYVKRINTEKPIKRYFKVSALVDVKNRKFLSIKVRKTPRHDVLDVKYLMKNSFVKPKVVLLDKGYDSEKLHKYFSTQKIFSIAPVKKNMVRGFYRKNLKRDFPQKLYNQRSLVESLFGAIKRKYGGSVSSKKYRSAVTEVYCKAILHNIFYFVLKQFRTEPFQSKNI